jgi:hypothetical protein
VCIDVGDFVIVVYRRIMCNIIEHLFYIMVAPLYRQVYQTGGFPEGGSPAAGCEERSQESVMERHRHRYEVNPEVVGKVQAAGLVFSGIMTYWM